MAERSLIEHAAYELHKAKIANSDDPELKQVAINTMALIRRIDKMNMTEKQLEYTLQAFQGLVNHQPLSPITTDPNEWEKFEIKRKNVDTDEEETRVIWQSRRMPSLFSEDEGKTFRDEATGKTGTSLDHLEIAAAEEKEAAAKAEATEKSAAPEDGVTDQKETK